MLGRKLQALVYHILPSTTAVFCYATGSRKLSANEQIFVGSQTVVNLLQTTQIKQGMSFIAAKKGLRQHKQNHNRLNRDGTSFLFLSGVDVSHVYVRALALGCFYSHISTRTFRRALTVSVDSCAEIKSALQWRNSIWQSLEEGAGKRCSECGSDSHNSATAATLKRFHYCSPRNNVLDKCSYRINQHTRELMSARNT